MKDRPKIIITDKEELNAGLSGQANAPPVLPPVDSSDGSGEYPNQGGQVVDQPTPQPNRGSNALAILSIVVALAIGAYVFWSQTHARSPQFVTDRTQTEQSTPVAAANQETQSPRSSEDSTSPEFSDRPDSSRLHNGNTGPVIPDTSESSGGKKPPDSTNRDLPSTSSPDTVRPESAPPPPSTDSPPEDTHANGQETTPQPSGPYEVPGFFSINVPGGWTTYVEGKSYHFKLSADVGIIITDSDNSSETELEQAKRADHAKSSSPGLLYKKHRLLNSPNEHIAVDSEGNPRHAVALIYEEKSPDTNAMRYMEKFCFRHYVNGTPVAAFLTIVRPLDSFRSYETEINTFLTSLKWTDR